MKIRTVLCPIDFTPLSDRAIALAVTLSRRFGARLVLEHNLDPRPPAFLSVTWMWSGDQASADTEKAHAAEDRLRVTLNGLPQDVAHEARLTRGPMDLGLAELARTLPADLLVMGSHGWSSAVHSSLTERLLEIAPCPVLALGSDAAAAAFLAGMGTERTPVLVPLDLSAHSRTTAAHALELLEHLPMELHFVHIEEGPYEPGDYESDRRRLEALVPEPRRGLVTFHIRSGERVYEILRAASDFDARLILMGCHAKSALERFFTGATAAEILHRAACPVWFEPAAMARAATPAA
jgi:universal stress protein A